MEDIIKKVRLEDYANRLIRQLSKGYKQRVGLAQAIVGYPELLILDEPTVGLDPLQIIEIRDLIKELAKNHTIILSSHILQEVNAVCDTIIIINKGKLLVNDKTENLGKYISGTHGLQLQVKGSKETVDGVLTGIPEITKIQYKDTAEAGTVTLTLFTEDDADIREKLFMAMSAAGCQILMMKDEEVTLESIFLQITKEDNQNTTKVKKVLVQEAQNEQEKQDETDEEETEEQEEKEEVEEHVGDL